MRQIDAADERGRVVDDHDFLMVRSGDRRRSVEPETDARPRMRLPPELVERHPLAIAGVDEDEVPRQDVHVQLAPLARDCAQQRADGVGITVVRALRNQRDPAVEVPAEHEDAALRLDDRRTQRSEVVGRVDEERHAMRAFDAPAVASGDEDGVRPRVRHADSLRAAYAPRGRRSPFRR